MNEEELKKYIETFWNSHLENIHTGTESRHVEWTDSNGMNFKVQVSPKEIS